MLAKLWSKFTKQQAKTREQPNPHAVYAPVSGSIVPLDHVPDPVFAGRMLGDGVAILPRSGDVLAPFDGEVVSLFPTGHAVGLRSSAGIECLIHIGMDTVELNGTGFQVKIRQGDRVNKGDLLIKADLGILEQAGKSPVTPVVVTNSAVWRLQQLKEGEAYAGRDILFSVEPK